ncbi:acyl--CoA ligase [Mesorhizobium sp. NZP2077]|uniref:class I adenylate-forming enzyme family protein n=1 Tax=Mesorhizobium sp. NZP2077 TaxID=2483404 RepID=UPI001552ECAE|nr:class I adenylate-forming enzyme family protein [Mesorhizobium sp. NZP2077]QKD19634.1 acyl--CoA ligase [Mesorhizobium sp. NZP2077]
MQTWSTRLARIFGDNAERAYMIDSATGEVTTYADLARRSASLVKQLERHGIKRGDRVGVLLPNGAAFATVYFACLFGGLTAVPVNNALSHKERAFVLKNSRLSALLTGGMGDGIASADTDHYQETSPFRPLILTICSDGSMAGRSLQVAKQDEMDRYMATIDDDRLWSIHFTSGTTGLPKGVAHRVGALLGNAHSFNSTFGIGRDSRFVHVMPMPYMAGFLNTLLGAFTTEASIILAPQFGPRSALRFWESVKAYGGDTIWMSPTMLAALTRIDRGEVGIELCRSKAIRIFSATAPLSTKVRREFETKYGVEVTESYGLSELLLIAANAGPAGRKDLSVGPCLPEVRITIRNGAGAEVAAGSDGAIFVHTPFASAGYIDFDTGAPAAPARFWFDTGDVGHLDDDGYLYVTGRVKDLIIRGGFNISPRQIEEVLLQHPAVNDAAVVGIPHDFYGEQVVAAFIPNVGVKLEDVLASLREQCLSALGPSTVPDRFVAFDVFPVTNFGKIRKLAIREVLIESDQSGSVTGAGS